MTLLKLVGGGGATAGCGGGKASCVGTGSAGMAGTAVGAVWVGDGGSFTCSGISGSKASSSGSTAAGPPSAIFLSRPNNCFSDSLIRKLMSDTPKDEALDLYGRSREVAAENLRKLILDAIVDPSFDIYTFAQLMQEDVEDGNPLHVVFKDNIVRGARIYVKASALYTEALANAVTSMIVPVRQETVELLAEDSSEDD